MVKTLPITSAVNLNIIMIYDNFYSNTTGSKHPCPYVNSLSLPVSTCVFPVIPCLPPVSHCTQALYTLKSPVSHCTHPHVCHCKSLSPPGRHCIPLYVSLTTVQFLTVYESLFWFFLIPIFFLSLIF